MKKLLLFFTGALLVAAPALSQDVDDIIKKHIEALGGAEKLAGIKTIKISGNMTMAMMGLEGQISRTVMRPNMVRMEIDVMGQTIVQAFDGEEAWQIMPFMGNPNPDKMPEEQAKLMTRDADLDGPLVDYKKKGHKVELLGEDDFEGTKVYKLKVMLKNGAEYLTFIDAEHHLELKQITKVKSQQGGEVEATAVFGDFKPVNGVMMPHAITLTDPMNGSIEVTFSNVEVNGEVDESKFKKPAGE